MARRMPGSLVMPHTPHAPIAANQATITGPKNRPTTAVPTRCTANRHAMITAVSGTTHAASEGRTTFSPSTADSTEIAGVIMLSPRNSAAPSSPSPASRIVTRALPPAAHRRSSAIRAMMPPSPWLSARMASST